MTTTCTTTTTTKTSVVKLETPLTFQPHPLSYLTTRSPPPAHVQLSDSHPRRLRADGIMEKTMVEMLAEGAYWGEDTPPTGVSVIGHTNGISGIGKIRDGIPSHNINLIHGGKAYGEDSAWVASHDVGEDKVVTMALFDGHGGEECRCKTSRRAMKMHAERRPTALARRLALVKTNDFDSLSREGTEHFQAIHDAVDDKSWSGCTASTVDIFLLSDGSVIVVADNVGDSPILLVCNKTGRVTVLHQAHNWDNPDEYRDHVAHWTAKGQTPYVPCYGTINTTGGIELPNPTNPDKPFPIYKEGTTEVDEKVAEYVWRAIKEKYPLQPLGGSQSMHRIVEEEQLEDGRWVDSRPVYPHENSGATAIDHHIQMSRSIGDHYFKTRHKPSSIAYKVPRRLNDVSLVVCSDGVGDYSHYFEIGDACRQMVETKPGVTGQEMADAYIRHMLLHPKKGFSVKYGAPRWDDLSIVISRIVRA